MGKKEASVIDIILTTAYVFLKFVMLFETKLRTLSVQAIIWIQFWPVHSSQRKTVPNQLFSHPPTHPSLSHTHKATFNNNILSSSLFQIGELPSQLGRSTTLLEEVGGGGGGRKKGTVSQGRQLLLSHFWSSSPANILLHSSAPSPPPSNDQCIPDSQWREREEEGAIKIDPAKLCKT